LTQWIFIALVAGFLAGVYAPGVVPWVRPFRALFLNGVKCIIAPLIFGTLVTGIAGGGSAKQVGKLGVRSILWFEIATTFALAIGLIAVNVLRPGEGLSIAAAPGHAVAV